MVDVNVTELAQWQGKLLGKSQWHPITQPLIDAFADVTGDKQWIHLDTARCAAESPFGRTIAHGFLSLSLLPVMSESTYNVSGTKSKINYGLNRLRFLAPVTEGSEIRLTITLEHTESPASDQVKATYTLVMEIKGQDKPAFITESVVLYYC